MTLPTLDDLKENLTLLDDWEQRYHYIIELGKSLPTFRDEYRNDDYKIKGCISQLWLHIDCDDDNYLEITADSDAMIVKGLVAIVIIIYQQKTITEAKNIDALSIFRDLGLEEHISANRRNGFQNMVAYINHYVRNITIGTFQ